MEGTDPGDDADAADRDDAGSSGLPEEIHVSAMNYWDRVIEDMEETAAEYEAEGWDALQLHPGDVTPLSGDRADRVGLDVLVPPGEFRALQSLLADGLEFDEFRVFKTQRSDVVFALVAMEDSASGQAVLMPVFYATGDRTARRMLDRARRDGVVRSYVRRLGGEYVELTHDDPELLAPPGERGPRR